MNYYYNQRRKAKEYPFYPVMTWNEYRDIMQIWHRLPNDKEYDKYWNYCHIHKRTAQDINYIKSNDTMTHDITRYFKDYINDNTKVYAEDSKFTTIYYIRHKNQNIYVAFEYGASEDTWKTICEAVINVLKYLH